MSVPYVPSPHALAQSLRVRVVPPTHLAGWLRAAQCYGEFRELVLELFKDRAQEILNAREEGIPTEEARLAAFARAVEREYFPLTDWLLEEYGQLLAEIPFRRDAWDWERFHYAEEYRLGIQLMWTLIEDPFDRTNAEVRVPLLLSCERDVPRVLLLRVPEIGLNPEQLHKRLDGTPFEAAALFADWQWHDTGSSFLDIEADDQLMDAEWSREAVEGLARQWKLAESVLDRIYDLATWLEEYPPARFEALLEAATNEARERYLDERRHYDHEITPDGIVAVEH